MGGGEERAGVPLLKPTQAMVLLKSLPTHVKSPLHGREIRRGVGSILQIKYVVPIIVVLNAGIDNVEKATARLKCRVIKVRPETEQANQAARR